MSENTTPITDEQEFTGSPMGTSEEMPSESPITPNPEVDVVEEFEGRDSFNIYYTPVGASVPDPVECKSLTVGELRREFNIPLSHKVTVMMSSECDDETPIEENNFVNVNH